MNKLVLLAVLSLPVSLFAQGGLPDKPYIYVEGKAEIEKPADMVTLRFDVVARNADQGKANQEVQTKANKIFALLKDAKIAENNVIADDIRSEPQFEGDENSRPKQGKIIGYSVTRSFSAKTEDISAFPKLVNDLLGMSAVQFTKIETGLSKEKEMRDEIFDKALTNARERGQKMLKPMGMMIDSVFAVSSAPFQSIGSEMFEVSPTTERVVVTGNYIPTGDPPAPSEYRLAPIAISQSVHIIYLISPAK
jgi:uncharacterized protein YggE